MEREAEVKSGRATTQEHTGKTAAPKLREGAGGPPRSPEPLKVASARLPLAPPTAPTPRATRGLSPLVFPALFVVSDSFALCGALALTYWLRFFSGAFESPLGVPDVSLYARTLWLIVPAGLAALVHEGMYRDHRRARFRTDLWDAARAVGMLCLILVTSAFFYREESFSRSMLVGFWGLATLFVAGARLAVAEAHRQLHARGLGVERVALVGGGALAERLAHRIEEQPGFGMNIVSRLEDLDWRGVEAADGSRLRLARVRGLAESGNVDRIIVTDSRLAHEERLELVEACHRRGVLCDFVPDLFEVMMGRVRVEEIDGVPLVGAKLHPLGRWQRVQKRGLDLLLSGTALLLFAPLFAILAFAVRLDSKGPVFFRQRRLGRDGREFEIVKFRSMPIDAEVETGPVRASRTDRRATRLGSVLRRTSFDELPQLVNVLRGEMSLVGPRPERPVFVGQFQSDIPRYLERHGVKSGLTGWAQVHGLRGDTSIEERTRYDIWYVENWSLGLDLKIILLTAVRFLFHKEAY